MNVYVYYEANEGDLTTECGAVTDIQVFGSKRTAVSHFLKKIVEGGEDGFVFDEESDLIVDNRISFGAVLDKLKKNLGYASITMFYNEQNNWSSHYDCIIERKEIIR